MFCGKSIHGAMGIALFTRHRGSSAFGQGIGQGKSESDIILAARLMHGERLFFYGHGMPLGTLSYFLSRSVSALCQNVAKSFSKYNLFHQIHRQKEWPIDQNPKDNTLSPHALNDVQQIEL